MYSGREKPREINRVKSEKPRESNRVKVTEFINLNGVREPRQIRETA
jgi:hypothetical protein